MISIAFIRHGATEGNLEKRYIGRTDEPLCDVGVQQALNLQNGDFPKDYIFVSPKKRAIQTAEIIFSQNNFFIIDDLRETDFGAFEGKTASELSENNQYKAWVDSMCTSPIPQGENIREFKKRCINAFEKITESIPDNSGASFVVHGGVIMAILEAFSEDKRSFYDYHIANGEFILCSFENGRIQFFQKE